MIYLFSDEGMATLRRFVSRDTLFAFDLDGTLAPIVADPERIAIPDDIRQGMTQLSALAATAVITGRAHADARRHLGFEPRFLVGNHGLEGVPGPPPPEEEIRSLVRSWERQLEALLPPSVGTEILLERKGFSLSLHYRHAADPVAVHGAMLAAIDRLDPPPRRVGGKFVENLIPQGAPDKGAALMRLMAHADTPMAIFVGDDETDEDVFRLRHPSILSIHVGMARESHAAYALRQQQEMTLLLRNMLELLNP